MTEAAKPTYGAENITVLEGLEPVRKRPEMYIGTTDRQGLHHLVWEIIDNAVDEALGGHCNEIHVTLTDDGGVVVRDNGRGIPVSIHPTKGISALTLIFTVLHAGGKFDSDSYKVSGGLHGVGSSVVNALSRLMEVEVGRDGGYFKQTFMQGTPQGPLVRLGGSDETYSQVTFYPDPEMFGEAIEEGGMHFDFDRIASRMQQTAYLTKGLTLSLTQGDRSVNYYSENGLFDWINVDVPEETQLHTPLVTSGDEEGVFVDLAICYDKGYHKHTDKGHETKVSSFVNNVITPDGGNHKASAISELVKAINNYGMEHELIKQPFKPEDTFEGLNIIISVRLGDPKFVGQTKSKLSSTQAGRAVRIFTEGMVKSFLEENPAIAKRIVKKAVDAKKAREAADRSRDGVRRAEPMNTLGTLPGKLSDCQSRSPEETELFIVEGDSAGGSAKQGRDRYFQAVLPLRGKVLNARKEMTRRLEASEQISNIISAFGCGTGDNVDLEKLRYGKLIIMTDADVDGAHIAVLLLTLFLDRMPEILKAGHVYMAVPPLYRAAKTNESRYFATEAQLDEFKASADGMTGKWEIQRFKGLGEMDPEQLWETTMDPANRTLHRIQYNEDMQEEVDQVFEMLMGKKVPPRRDFIEANLVYAEAQ